MICKPERPRAVFNLLKSKLLEHTGIHLHLGKTKVYNKAGEEPPRVRELQQTPEEPVWVGDRALPAEKQGFKVLGTPLGTDAYVRKLGEKRLLDEQSFWQKLPGLPDLQSAWL